MMTEATPEEFECQIDTEEESPDYIAFVTGREHLARGEYENALKLFQQSLDLTVHYKTLELIGICLCQLGRHREAIVPLAAAAGLNRGSQPCCLLAETFGLLGDWTNARKMADEALRRSPGFRRAIAILDKAARHLEDR